MLRLRFCLLFLPAIFAGCGQKSTGVNQAPPPKNVLVAQVVRHDVPVQLHEFGRITSPESVDVKPQVSGRVTEVHFNDGQEVKKGDLLFVIDPRPFQADLEQAQGQLQADQGQLQLTQRNLGRDEQIGKQRFVSEQQLDQDRTQVQNYQGAVTKDQAAIDLAKLNLEYCYVRAPINGRTGRRLVDPGNYVSTGGSTLVNIQRQDLVYVDFNISENDLARVRENLPGNTLTVDVVSPTRPDAVKSGSLSFFDNAVSTQAGTVLLRGTVQNDDRFLWPGQYVNVALTLKVLKGALVVPSQTIQLGGKGPYLFVLKPDHSVEQRQAVPGPRFGDLTVVSEGVEASDTVVVEGQLALGNGTKVNPSEYKPNPPSGSGPGRPGLTENTGNGGPDHSSGNATQE
ncbi:MAG: efflux RND transporter periplasmic adaptor subunit, partial [Verrucomicrobia bacterium]|nr:efflux RND transporter periplasmic adaptor subunit [Verrucomicrobiota bacterium]